MKMLPDKPRRRRRGSRLERGLTIMELGVAMSIFFFVGICMMSLFAAGSRMPVTIENRMDMTEQARIYMQEILLTPTAPPLGTTVKALAPFPPSTVAYTCTQVVTTGQIVDPYLNLVHIQLTFTAPGGQTESFDAEKMTQLPNRGLSLINQYGCFGCHTMGPGVPVVPLAPNWNLYELDTTVANNTAPGTLPAPLPPPGSLGIQALIIGRLNNPNNYLPAGYAGMGGSMTNFGPGGENMPPNDEAQIAAWIYQNAPLGP